MQLPEVTDGRLYHVDVLLPSTGIDSADGVAHTHPAKDELFARCNLQEATLDGLFTSCPCKGQVHL